MCRMDLNLTLMRSQWDWLTPCTFPACSVALGCFTMFWFHFVLFPAFICASPALCFHLFNFCQPFFSFTELFLGPGELMDEAKTRFPEMKKSLSPGGTGYKILSMTGLPSKALGWWSLTVAISNWEMLWGRGGRQQAKQARPFWANGFLCRWFWWVRDLPSFTPMVIKADPMWGKAKLWGT